MENKSVRIAKNTALLYARMLITMVVTLYTSRVVLEALGEIDYGIYNTVGGIVTMFTFLNGSILIATQRYLTFYLGKGDKEMLQKIFSASVYIHGILALIIVALVESIGMWFLENKLVIPMDRVDAARWVLHCSAASTFVMLVSTPYNALIVAHEKMSTFAYISILEVTLKLFIAYAIVIATSDKLILYTLLWFCVHVLLRIIYGVYCKKKFSESRLIGVGDYALFKNLFSFASWSILSTFAWSFQSQGVNFVLNMFFGPAVNAARGIAVQVQAAVKGFSKNFQMALNPQITKSYANGDLSYMHKLIYASSKYSYFLLLIFSMPIVMEANFILNLWLVDVPQYTVEFLRITLFISMTDSMFNSFMIGVQATGKQKKLQLIVSLFWLLVVPLSFMALEWGSHPMVVFIVEIICSFTGQLVALHYCKQQIGISFKGFLTNSIGRILLVTLMSFSVLVLLKMLLNNSVLASLAMIVLSLVLTVFMIYAVGLSSEERHFIKAKMLKKKFHK